MSGVNSIKIQGNINGVQDQAITIADGAILVTPGQTNIDNINITNNTFSDQDTKLSLSDRLKTINHLYPKAGNIFILGQRCISVFDDKDPDYKEFYADETQPTSNTITIFDGCDSCSGDCIKLHQIYKNIRDYQIWLTSLKDILLYNQTDCDQLFRQILTQVGSSNQSGQNCPAVATPQRDTWLSGIQLLQQYKSLIALWNYLAGRRSNASLITTANQDFSGMDITFKKSIDLCVSNNASTTTLTIRVLAQNQQVLPKNNACQDEGMIALLVLCNNQNTYLQLGSNYSQNNSNRVQYDKNIAGSYSSDLGQIVVTLNALLPQDQNPVTKNPYHTQGAQAVITFKSNKLALSVMSGSIKVIPVWVSKQPDTMMTLQQYVDKRTLNTKIKAQQQYANVTWSIEYTWAAGQTVLMSDTKKYTTPYTRYPGSYNNKDC